MLLFSCFQRLNWHLLVWIACLPLLIAVVNEPRLWRAFLLGALSGALFLLGGVYWFIGVMQRYGGLSLPAALSAMASFLIVFSSFWGAFGLVEAWVAQRARRVGMALALAPFLWVATELARTYYVLTGFPWNLLGYAVQADHSGHRLSGGVGRIRHEPDGAEREGRHQ